MTFIVGFDDGRDHFDPIYYGINILVSMIAVSIAFFIHEFAHRITAVNLGYKADFKPSLYGLLAGILVTLMSYGKVMLLAHGSFYLNIMEKHRLGYFRHYLGYFDNGKVAIAGPLANLAAAMFFSLFTFIPGPLIDKIILVNALMAIVHILPIPYLDGAHVMYSTRKIYPFIMSAVTGAALILLAAIEFELPFDVPWWGVLIGSMLIGIFGTIMLWKFEDKYFGKW